MLRVHPFVEGEVYHIYNRGAGKQNIFLEPGDYLRFQALLYAANSTKHTRLSSLFADYARQKKPFIHVFGEERSDPLVQILAYCLMPNHFHLMVRLLSGEGIVTFMRRAMSAFSSHHNAKYDHSGTLFQGRYKSRHVNDDAYLQWLFIYIHSNPISLVEPDWKDGKVADVAGAERFLDEYRYSSFMDYRGVKRPESAIVSPAPDIVFLREGDNTVSELLKSQTLQGYFKDRLSTL